jgi:hypothetical protein
MVLRLSFFCKSCREEEIKREEIEWLSHTEWEFVEIKNGKVTIKCSSGHKYTAPNFAEMKKKIIRHPHCSKCELIERGQNFKAIFEESGWKMQGEYQGIHIPIRCVCPNGHIQMKNPTSFLAGNDCKQCSGLLRHSQVDVEKEFEKFGWRVIGKYQNTSDPMECVCENGHIVKKSLDCLRISPKGCIVCSGQVPIHSVKKRARKNERMKNSKTWSPLILARDGGRCVICGSEYGVTAHHLNSYHKSVDSRYDLDNGVTLCGKHHGGPFNRVPNSFHMVFGCMNNTKEQFEEYRRMCASGKVRV